ncbi:hypothetical protein D3P07_17250 [Paenibacillus sp. 1011MAR3C5]|uniref:PKD domain-containing protein n=1 Tax=Paenibacillus sp. 1011MAR3C5 TaxID=1675787 RepID=UPI000E6CF98B|nr:PKD domain-containing protein [Paenibacillus sp. 1011MAR3C5]RJE86927.1 hypothetical protein D3P07_17250 [Paenibacillus sp. 1011MAR3C5]
MKRFLSIVLLSVLLFDIVLQTPVVKANSALSSTFLVETTSSTSESQIEVTLDWPTEAAMIIPNRFSYKGKGTIVSVKSDDKTKKNKVVISGEKKQVKEQVKGYQRYALGVKYNFSKTPGNAFCRYSDGGKWQINSFSTDTHSQYRKDYFRESSATLPTMYPPYSQMSEIVGYMNIDLTDHPAVWVNNAGDTVEANKVKNNTIQILSRSHSSSLKTYTALGLKDYDPYKPRLALQYKAEHVIFTANNQIPASNPAFYTGHAQCYGYPFNLQYFLQAEAEYEAYHYGGTITFQYSKFASGVIAGEVKPDPVSERFDGKDVKVKVTISSEIFEIKDPGAIDYYDVYLNNELGDQKFEAKAIPANRNMKISRTFDFVIPASRMTNKNSHDEVYVGRVRACYKPSSYYVDPVNGKCMDTGKIHASTNVYKEKAPDPPVKGMGPVAIINAPTEVMLGDDITLDGTSSYDPDGTIEKYVWNTPNAIGSLVDVPVGEVYYNKLGTQKVQLCVWDNDGERDCGQHSLVVTEPFVKANIFQSGTLKENRKVTFSEFSFTSSRYPVIASKNQWTIKPVYDDIPQSMIKYQGNLNGKSQFDVLFKQPGDYVVTLSVENIAGYKDTTSRIVTIKPDLPPVTVISAESMIEYRDPKYMNKAKFVLRDTSYSPDGDIVAWGRWYVIFDENNDGIFREQRVLIYEGDAKEVIYYADHVGKYQFHKETIEEFGQETIPAFVTVEDRRRSHTWE